MKTETTNKSIETQQKTLRGVVVSDAMDKTIVVKVERFVKHPKYQKFQKISKKYKAHDEENAFKIGDIVDIVACRPLSKDKHFMVVSTSNQATA